MIASLGVSVFVSTLALLVSPVAANACPSLARVKSFHGEASLSFKGTASYQGETTSLDRTASDMKFTLKRQGSNPLGQVLFAGKASGGDVSVQDSLMNPSGSASETHNGPASNKLPNVTAVQLQFDTKTCKYLLFVEFGVPTTFSGNPDLRDQPGATGEAWSGHRPIPASLKLGGAPVPPAYAASHCNQPKVYAKGCYGFGATWATELEDDKTCHGTCGSSQEPMGTALFSWALKPTFKHHKK